MCNWHWSRILYAFQNNNFTGLDLIWLDAAIHDANDSLAMWRVRIAHTRTVVRCEIIFVAYESEKRSVFPIGCIISQISHGSSISCVNSIWCDMNILDICLPYDTSFVMTIVWFIYIQSCDSCWSITLHARSVINIIIFATLDLTDDEY